MAQMEKCPNCGGTKSVDLGNGKHRCLYCGTTFTGSQPAPQPAPQPQQPQVVVVNQQNQNVQNSSCLEGCFKGVGGIISFIVGLFFLIAVTTCPH